MHVKKYASDAETISLSLKLFQAVSVFCFSFYFGMLDRQSSDMMYSERNDIIAANATSVIQR